MKPKNEYKALALVLVLAMLMASCATLGSTQANSPLQASGLIEATETGVAPELSGRVSQVLVQEGDPVQTGQTLIRLDGALLQAQHQAAAAALAAAQSGVQTAQAGLDSAQLQYDQTLSAALAAAAPQSIDTWKQSRPSGFDQPAWYFSQADRLQATQAQVELAKTALEQAQQNLSSVQTRVGSASYLQAEQRLVQARVAYQAAQQVLDQTNGASDGQDLRDAAQTSFDQAKTELEDAQQAYRLALTTTGAQDVQAARAKVTVAQARYDMLIAAQRELQTGVESPEVKSAAQAVDQAKAALGQAQAEVEHAQAELKLIEVQQGQLEVTSPLNGVVLTRSIQPGEVLPAGQAALTVANLDTLKVTVYIPEDRYGQIHLNESASLSVDSFPGETFQATVTSIAEQAEYTPRNVQTKEERQTTVYAVALSVPNPEGKLKPGMPVDVTFGGQ